MMFSTTSYLKEMRHITVLQLVLFLECNRVIDGGLTWRLQNEYVIYGRKATLRCETKDCSPKSMIKWIGGQNYKLLTFNGSSTDPSKYEIYSIKESFHLIIKNFDITDLNCKYTCACGFLQYTESLSSNNASFIYFPTKSEIIDTSSANEEEIELHITVKRVHPLPYCSVFYGDDNHDKNMSMVYHGVSSDNTKFYNIDLRYAFETDTGSCAAKIRIMCKMQFLNFTLLERSIDTCKDSKYTGIIIGLVVVGIIVSSLTLVVIVCCFRRRKTSNSIPDNNVCRDKNSVEEAQNDSLINTENKNACHVDKVSEFQNLVLDRNS